MPKGTPLPPEKADAITADILAGGKSARAIAKDHQVGVSTVSDVAARAGISDAFDRSKTEAATQAHAADCRARREKLKAELLDDAERLRKRAWERYEVVVDSRTDGPQTLYLDLPPLQDVRAAYAAIGIAIDKSVRLEQYDSNDSASDAKGMLGALAEGISAWVQANPDPEGADADG